MSYMKIIWVDYEEFNATPVGRPLATFQMPGGEDWPLDPWTDVTVAIYGPLNEVRTIRKQLACSDPEAVLMYIVVKKTWSDIDVRSFKLACIEHAGVEKTRRVRTR